MTYSEAIDYLLNKTLMFQHVGSAAYKPGLETTLQINDLFGNPDKSYRAIHVAGTNGKGSTAHLLAAILQQSGYRIGLYTSPHLLDFRERIKVNGEMIPESDVADFVERFLSSGFTGRQPSFFEISTIMAFDYFKRQKVDIAVIEVGLGGRLDSTNIITPILSVITNISLDHTQFLGDTLAKIATEKAGIIKPHVPVVIGEKQPETTPVFLQKAESENAPIFFADDAQEIRSYKHSDNYLDLETVHFGIIHDELTGDCQLKNANTVLNAVKCLCKEGINIPTEAISEGFRQVCEITGLMGRWMKLTDTPLTICDTGHNIGGFTYLARQLKASKCHQLHIVIGFVSDKDISHILPLLPKNACYYFTQASVPRALSATTLQEKAHQNKLEGHTFPSVAAAYTAAKEAASGDDMIYIGGSTFIVADLLCYLKASE